MKVIFFCLYASMYLPYNKGTTTNLLPRNAFVPAIIAFGDSIMDPGNNNYLNTFTKANFPPYGKDFLGGEPTGRFNNGKILGDFIAKALGVKEYLPAYLDSYIQDKDFITGVSFASAGTGYDPLTASLASVISLSLQAEMFKQYIEKLKRIVGEGAANNIITNSVYIVSASSNDFLTNYFANPIRRSQYDVPEYANKLVEFAVSFIQEIHALGARRIVVFSAVPLGCVPIERTLLGGKHRKCVEKFNRAAKLFNSMLRPQLQLLSSTLPQARVTYCDCYNPLTSIIENPHIYGLEVTNLGCCGTGLLEMGYACNEFSALCHNDSAYFFWDSLHPSEKGCEIFTNLILPDIMKSIF
uniref:GDSL esterase/lipase At5g42170-like n=1 Tax=Erigeron canadensis TaxID=72917 RepID=UPI001CB8DB2F|nr:GDSL esterase/lipase At5g42170-like [Erigeron canadensis]